jgi:hypothetical protein
MKRISKVIDVVWKDEEKYSSMISYSYELIFDVLGNRFK